MQLEMESRNGETFLLYRCPKERVDTVTLGMLTNNRVKGILPLTAVQWNEDCLFRINITGKLSFAAKTQGMVQREWFLTFLHSFLKTIKTAEEYLIMETELLLELEYLFFDIKTGELELLCLPEFQREGAVTAFVFLKWLLLESQYDPSENCDYVARLISLCNQAGVTSEEIQSELAALLQASPGRSAVLQRPEEIRQPDPATFSLAGTEQEKMEIPNKGSSGQERISSRFGFLFFKKEKKKEEEKEEKKKEKRKEGKEEKKEADFMIPGVKVSFGQTEQASQVSLVLEKEKEKAVEAGSLQTVLLGQNSAAGTRILTEEPPGRASLRRVSTRENISVKQPMFYMGRQSMDVDYCIQGNDTIGRKHAAILKRGRKYYLMDLDSRNHTYLNGTMLEPEKEYELSDGDCFRLSNEDFVFQEG